MAFDSDVTCYVPVGASSRFIRFLKRSYIKASSLRDFRLELHLCISHQTPTDLHIDGSTYILLPSLSLLSECLPRFRHYLDSAAVVVHFLLQTPLRAAPCLVQGYHHLPSALRCIPIVLPPPPLPLKQGPPLHTIIKTPADEILAHRSQLHSSNFHQRLNLHNLSYGYS